MSNNTLLLQMNKVCTSHVQYIDKTFFIWYYLLQGENMNKNECKVSDQEVIAAWHEFEETGQIKQIAQKIGLKVGYFRIRAKKLKLYTPDKQKRDYTIEDCNLWAKKNDINGNGHCRELKYLGQNEYHNWKCSNPNHDVFPAIAKSVMNGTWCQKCYDEQRSEKLQKYTIKDCKATAAEHNGKCLSIKYSTNKLKWECEYGHLFDLEYNVIVNLDRWCSCCDRNKNEEYTRFIFNTIFATEFKKTNLVKLDLYDRKLELDGYAPGLKLAFEYNGIYHTEDETHPLYSPETLRNDAEKAKVCIENGIKLVIVPEFPKLNPDRWDLVETALKNSEITIPQYKRTQDLPLSFRSAYHYRIEEYIESKGGCLETQAVLTATDKIRFYCEKGHLVTSLSPHKLLAGQWCKHNMNNRKLSETDIQARSENVNSNFLSSYRKDSNTIWCMKCDEGL